MKKFMPILSTIVSAILFTSCNSNRVTVLSTQKQDPEKIITLSNSKKSEPNSNSIYNPPEQSKEELYQDIFVSLLMPDIQKSVDDYYKDFLTESPMVSPDYVHVLSAERLMGYRSFSFRLKLKVSSFIGPHLNIGDDYITVKVEAGNKATVEKFEHIKSYYLDLPSNYQNIIIRK